MKDLTIRTELINFMMDKVYSYEHRVGETWTDQGGVPVADKYADVFMVFLQKEYPDAYQRIYKSINEWDFFDWNHVQDAGIYDDGTFDDTIYEDNLRIICHFVLECDKVREFIEFLDNGN